MAHFILWYLTISIIGWLAFPLAYRLLPSLSDRGYTISRTLGFLLWGYVFWLLASLGMLPNATGGWLLALGVLIALSVWALRSLDLDDLRAWWLAHRGMVLVTELLFLVAFAGWTYVRAANPEAVGTEKPMELAFINAILNSPNFPPHDPWLSGYAISYYYFGYVLVALLAGITATPGAVAFNLGLTLVFALSAIASFGLIYNLLAALRQRNTKRSQRPSLVASLLGPVFVLLISNLEGFLHMLHTRGLFWSSTADGGLNSAFWKWLDIKDLNLPPETPFSWAPTRFWWWWRASRVLQDYDLAGNPLEIIDEFPTFSYLLGDLHPHVLGMPFVFLAMTLALSLFLNRDNGQTDWFNRRFNLRMLTWISTVSLPAGFILFWIGLGALKLSLAIAGIALLLLSGFGFFRLRQPLNEHGLKLWTQDDLGSLQIGTPLYLDPKTYLLAVVVLGGIAMLNTWDFPFYITLYAGAYAMGLVLHQRARLSEALVDFVWLGLALGVGGILFYLPFYIGFSSQAGGPLPNLINPTRGAHLWVMFATLLLPLGTFLIYLLRKAWSPANLRKGTLLALGFMLFLWIISLVLGLAIVTIPQVSEFYQGFLGASDSLTIFRSALNRRLVSAGGWITLAVLLSITLGLLLGVNEDRPVNEDIESQSEPGEIEAPPTPRSKGGLLPPHIFALLLTLLGTLLVIGPEFLYLRDMFGWRMNTIFKFYFQAWLLWSIAAAYGAAFLLGALQGGWSIAFRLLMLFVLIAGLVYPVFGVWSKTNGLQPLEWTLDSTAHITRGAPDEMAAVKWLNAAPPGTVAEAVAPEGGSYTNYARVSMLSGQPAVLGWVGHESQWRGGHNEIGTRQQDLERLYCSRSWEEAKAILDEYNIRYIVIGSLERITYEANAGSCTAGIVETKFVRNLQPVFQQGQVTIYEYNPSE